MAAPGQVQVGFSRGKQLEMGFSHALLVCRFAPFPGGLPVALCLAIASWWPGHMDSGGLRGVRCVLLAATAPDDHRCRFVSEPVPLRRLMPGVLAEALLCWLANTLRTHNTCNTRSSV